MISTEPNNLIRNLVFDFLSKWILKMLKLLFYDLLGFNKLKWAQRQELRPQILKILYYTKMAVKLWSMITMSSNELTHDFILQYDYSTLDKHRNIAISTKYAME